LFLNQASFCNYFLFLLFIAFFNNFQLDLFFKIHITYHKQISPKTSATSQEQHYSEKGPSKLHETEDCVCLISISPPPNRTKKQRLLKKEFKKKDPPFPLLEEQSKRQKNNSRFENPPVYDL